MRGPHDIRVEGKSERGADIMRLTMAQNFAAGTSAILMAVAIATLGFSVSILRAQGAHDSAAATFRTKCAVCHGPDGAGSEAGKSLNIPDLRSPAVQKLPDAELAEIISNGKAGMPPFKSSLSADQIHALVRQVRSLGRKK
jgi:mono/diheme cytochrome c family protein